MIHNFSVFAKLPYEVILGTEFIYAKGLQLNLGSGVVYTTTPPARAMLLSHQRSQEYEQTYSLEVRQDVTLEPCTMSILATHSDNLEGTSTTGLILDEQSQQDAVLFPVEGIVERHTSTNTIPVCMTNTTDEPIIKAGTIVAWYSPIPDKVINTSCSLDSEIQAIQQQMD